MTKDERYLIEIYKTAKNPQDRVNPESIQKKLGIKDKLAKNILKGLMQANLVKRCGEEEICLTQRGVEVALSLLK